MALQDSFSGRGIVTVVRRQVPLERDIFLLHGTEDPDDILGLHYIDPARDEDSGHLTARNLVPGILTDQTEERPDGQPGVCDDVPDQAVALRHADGDGQQRRYPVEVFERGALNSKPPPLSDLPLLESVVAYGWDLACFRLH